MIDIAGASILDVVHGMPAIASERPQGGRRELLPKGALPVAFRAGGERLGDLANPPSCTDQCCAENHATLEGTLGCRRWPPSPDQRDEGIEPNAAATMAGYDVTASQAVGSRSRSSRR